MNIFVAKLSRKTTSESLKSLFEQYGEVSSSKVIMDRDTGYSKCYGFVEIDDNDDALKSISELNDTVYEDHTIVVKQAESRR
ncbi:MAG: RNA recognition motif-containing protein [Cyclobacteriaceae bacterium]|jgi:RNA recognition motif-containing protein